MNKSKFDELMKSKDMANIAEKFYTPPQACYAYKLSRNKLMEIAKAAGALRHFGRSVRIDVKAMDAAIEKMN